MSSFKRIRGSSLDLLRFRDDGGVRGGVGLGGVIGKEDDWKGVAVGM
jgi:hypothetical protein